MAIVHTSKIDFWLIAVVVLSVAVCVVAVVAVASSASAGVLWMSAALSAIAAFLPVWLLLSTRYAIEPGQVVIRSGPFRWHIPIAEITDIVPTSNALSSPALSLDRLRISYGRGRVLMISPRDKEQFLKDLEGQRSAV
jgi:hypothetical protein